MKKNILFIEFCPISGSSNGLITEIDYINKHYRDSVNCIVISSSNSIFLKASSEKGFVFHSYDAVELTNLDPKKLFNYLKGLIFIMRIMVRYHVDIIHCNHYMWSIYANPVGFIFNKPVIIHLKDVWLLQPKVARILMKFNPRSQYIAVSKYVKKLFIKSYKINKKKTVMIYDGIDEEMFYPISRQLIEKKQNNETKKVVMMSRVVPERDIEIFIDIASTIEKKYPKIHFYHYGYSKIHSDATYIKKLQSRVKKLHISNFTFHTYLSDPKKVAEVLRESYLTIVPARRFALPNTAIESMMCGTPAILFNTGGNKEIVSNNQTGRLIDVNTSHLYVEAIEEYIRTPLKYVQTAIDASAYAKKQFNSEQQNKKITRLYKI